MGNAVDISVIIPVLNEGAKINRTLHQLQQCAVGVNYEVIVVDGDPQGSTIAHIDPIPTILTLTAPRGRGTQMNVGAYKAQGKILLFLHADTQLPPQALAKIWALLTQTPYVGGAFDLRIDSRRWSLKAIAQVASLRSRLTRVPYGDQAIFIRQDFFEAADGYPDVPIMEDVALMQRIQRLGGQIYIFSNPVLVSARRWEKEGILYCTLRNWLLLTLYYLGVNPHRLAAWYRSI